MRRQVGCSAPWDERPDSRGQPQVTEDLFTDVCAFDELPNGGRRVFDVNGAKVLCVRINREVSAVINACTHLGLPLDKGRVIGHQISCPAHGACFDLVTGRAYSGPAVLPLTVLPVKIDAGRVLVLVRP